MDLQPPPALVQLAQEEAPPEAPVEPIISTTGDQPRPIAGTLDAD